MANIALEVEIRLTARCCFEFKGLKTCIPYTRIWNGSVDLVPITTISSLDQGCLDPPKFVYLMRLKGLPQ